MKPHLRRANTKFQRKVEQVIRSIPLGRVLSYSQVALRAGKPGNPRAVVQALHQISNAPWWRVIRADGTVAAQVAPRQIRLLKREGLQVRGRRVLPR